jgi:hypothetical protein
MDRIRALILAHPMKAMAAALVAGLLLGLML